MKWKELMISGIFLWDFKKYPKFSWAHWIWDQWSAEAAGVVHACPAALAAVCSCENQDQNAARSTDESLFLEGMGFKNRSQDILALPVPSWHEMELSDRS